MRASADARTPRALLIGSVFVVLLGVTLVVLAVRLSSAPPRMAALSGDEPRSIPPRSLEPDETYVLTEVLPSGDLEVTHWIESTVLLFSVALSVPAVDGAEDVEAVDVHVVADGREATGPDRLAGPKENYSFLGARSVQVRYRLTGALERSTSAPGRALALPTSLDLRHEPASQQVTRRILAPEVLSLACSSPSLKAVPRPCGGPGSDGAWRVKLDGERSGDRVLAQVTLE